MVLPKRESQIPRQRSPTPLGAPKGEPFFADKIEMRFRPAYTTREAVLDFTSAQRLRDVKLLHETPA